MTKQAWAIVPRIKEVDLLFSASPELRERIREVHPELCFAAWNNGSPMAFRKRKREGKEERARLIREVYGDEVLKEIRSKFLKKDVGDDDLHDAFAALWTAERMSCNTAIRIPSDQEQIDANGLSMEMWY